MTKKRLLICLLAFLGLTFYLVVTKGNALAGWLLDSQGRLIYEPDGQVLGKRGETGKPSSPPGQTIRQGLETAPQTTIEVQEGPAAPGQDKKNKVILERAGNKLKITVTDENGEEIEIPEGTESGEFEIEDPEDKNTTKVRSTGNAYMVIRNKIGAQTHFPLMVNLDTNELIVTTPKGQKVVTVLPDKAVENMLAANVIDQLGGKGGLRWLEYQASQATPSATPTPDEATPSATPTPEDGGDATEAAVVETASVEDVITLTSTRDGTLAYEIPGIKFKKLFGIFKVKLYKTAIVSAETGELLGTQEAFLTKILDLLSFE